MDQEILFAVYTPKSSVRLQDGKAYPMPGSYEGTISYKKETGLRDYTRYTLSYTSHLWCLA